MVARRSLDRSHLHSPLEIVILRTQYKESCAEPDGSILSSGFTVKKEQKKEVGLMRSIGDDVRKMSVASAPYCTSTVSHISTVLQRDGIWWLQGICPHTVDDLVKQFVVEMYKYLTGVVGLVTGACRVVDSSWTSQLARSLTRTSIT